MVFRVKAALATLDLLDSPGPLTEAVINASGDDAYAAREVVAHNGALRAMGDQQRCEVANVANQAGLGTGSIPPAFLLAVTTAVDDAADRSELIHRF